MCHLKIVVTHTDRKPRAKTLHTPTCRGSSYFMLLRPDKDVLPGMEASLVGTERPQISEMVCVNTQRRANNSYHLPVVASLLHDLQERHLRRRSLLKRQAATHPPVTGLIICQLLGLSSSRFVFPSQLWSLAFASGAAATELGS